MRKHKNLKKLKEIQLIKNIFLNFRIPNDLSRNFISVNDFETKFNSIKKELNHDLNNKNDFEILNNRLDDHRKQIIPWLNSLRRLKGLRILEIGCGNGSSSIAFAEQGAIVTAIDVDENLISDAKIRCKLYGLNVSFILMNASQIDSVFVKDDFDLIIFMASLEHMTLDERLQSMKSTYNLLAIGSLWCIVDTPNRLNFMDSHTSNLPFFHWLPDQIALEYAQFSPRIEYKQHLAEINDEKEKMMQFYRWGRGVSYHEIELALKPLNELKIISNKAHFMRKNNWFYKIGNKFSSNYKFEIFLHKLYPTIHNGFFQPYLNMIFEKNSDSI